MTAPGSAFQDAFRAFFGVALARLSQLLIELAIANRGDESIDDARQLVEGRHRNGSFALVELDDLVAGANHDGVRSIWNRTRHQGRTRCCLSTIADRTDALVRPALLELAPAPIGAKLDVRWRYPREQAGAKGRVLSITRFLRNEAFDSELLEAMSAALGQACRVLGVSIGENPVTERRPHHRGCRGRDAHQEFFMTAVIKFRNNLQ